MEDKNLNLLKQISSEVANVYDFHDYDMSKEKIIELAKLMIRSYPKLTIEQTSEFCMNVNSGVYGTLYKAPSCFMSMFQEYVKSRREIDNMPPYHKQLPKL